MEGRWTCRCGRESPGSVPRCPRCGRQIQLVAPRRAGSGGHEQSPAVTTTGGTAPDAGSVAWPSPDVPLAPGRVQSPPAPPAARRKRLLVGVVGTLGVVIALVAGAIAVRSLTAADETAPPGGATGRVVPSPDSLQEVVLRLQRHVERVRGLQFKAPVKVTVLDDAPFRARLEASSSRDAGDLLGQEATLRALRLLPDDLSLAQARERHRRQAVGFYDPATKELYVKGAGMTPHVRYVLVHELTHALQDQEFDLARLGAHRDDAALAARAVVEGDAERTARAYLSTLPRAEQDAVRGEVPARQDDIYNQAYYASVDNFPYVVGTTWADTVREAGGQIALDNGFRTFPRSTAEIMHPDRYLAGAGPADVAPPPADGPVVDEGVVGEYQLVYLLTRAVDDQDAFDIARAWGGSRFVTWRSGDRSCTRARFTMLSTAADNLLAQALSAWAETTDARVEGAGPVVLTACDGRPS